MQNKTSIATSPKTAPLTEADIAVLKRRIGSKGRFLKEFALLPLRIIAISVVAMLPLMLATILSVYIYRLFSNSQVAPSTLALILVTLWLSTALIIAFPVIRSFLREGKERQLHTPALRADLENGVKIGETLEFEEALCVQEVEHRGLAYFCRTSDGRVFLILDEASPCWEYEDLAEGYRRGVDPRQERFVPLTTLTIWQVPHSKMFLEEEFSGTPVPRIEGIYEVGDSLNDFIKSSEFGRPPQIHQSWDEILRSHRCDSARVDWSEIIARAEDNY